MYPKIPSLFILSLPRSLSSDLYHLSSQALGLAKPTWTTDGEILNKDRVHPGMPYTPSTFLKYTTKNQNAESFSTMQSYLNHLVQPVGHIYKDVVQSFVMEEWLSVHPELKVLIIERNVIDVAHAMLMREWYWPGDIIENSSPNIFSKIVFGLKTAEATLKKVNGLSIKYEEFIENETILQKALQSLYPEIEVPLIPYLTEEFVAYRAVVKKRASTKLHEQLAMAIEDWDTLNMSPSE